MISQIDLDIRIGANSGGFRMPDISFDFEEIIKAKAQYDAEFAERTDCAVIDRLLNIGGEYGDVSCSKSAMGSDTPYVSISYDYNFVAELTALIRKKKR